MSHLLKQLADGRWVRADGKPDEIVRDGEAVRVPMIMLDNKPPAHSDLKAEHRRPRQGQMSDIDSVHKVCSRAKYLERITDAWRGGPPPRAVASAPPATAPQPTFAAPAQVTSDGSAAYQAYKRRLEDGYRHLTSSRVVV